MKKVTYLLAILLSFAACKNDKKETLENDDITNISEEIQKKEYPKDVAAVFIAHGGIDTWNAINNLCFEMESKGGTETHVTSLKNRLSKIEHKDWAIGYDGTNVWLQQHKEDVYKGNARFYHNLMFYFYAMPLILSDDGIIYETLQPTELDGKTYNAVKISYESGVGDSSEDEYIVYSDPETNKMVWLGYTVTYRSGEKSEDWHFIKYDKWQDVNGLLLPEKLTWYNVKDGKPTDERNDILFKKVTATETVLEPSVFAKPVGAVIVEK